MRVWNRGGETVGPAMWDLVRKGLRFLPGAVRLPLRGTGDTRAASSSSPAQMEGEVDKASYQAAPSTTTVPCLPAPSLEIVEADEIANVLETLAGYSRCFTLREFADWLDGDIHQDEARQGLMADPRFVWLGRQVGDEDLFIPERALFRWWCYLSLRLAQAKRARLTARQLAMAMSSLRLDGRWDAPPEKAVDFGRGFGFVGPAWTSGHYVFPLAHILSCLPPPSAKAARALLTRFTQEPGLSRALRLLPYSQGGVFSRFTDVLETLEQALKKPAELWVQEGFSKVSERVVQVVRAREGLEPDGPMTLEQLGRRLGVTRERVRQIEQRFWEGLSEHPLQKSLDLRLGERVRPFVTGLLSDVMRSQGSLIVAADTPGARLRRFVAKCSGLALVELPHTALLVLGVSPEDIPELGSPYESILGLGVDADAVAHTLESQGLLCFLVASDIRAVAESVARHGLKHINKAQRVCLALREIGRPSHYSRITEVYNSMFPEDWSTEHNVHAVLGREQHGVVWIGVRGTYALKEWGYEHPPVSLFDAATEIVERRFKETGKPVPFTVVMGEIGKYRKVVNPHSMVFATHCNPKLRRVSKDSFVPRQPGDRMLEEVAQDELDQILGEFEKRRAGE